MRFPSFPSKNSKEYKLHRRLEMIPGLATWITLLGAVASAFLFPIFAVIVVIFYDFYWLVRTVIISGHSVIAYKRMKKAVKVDWFKKCKQVKSPDELKLEDIYHLIIIPYYKEGLAVLQPSIKAILESNFPSKKIIISISAEERGGKKACLVQEKLKKKYGKHFKAFLTNIHPDKKEEMKNKACNSNWAAQAGIRYLKKQGIPFENVVASNLDSDTCISPQYLAAVAYSFLKSKDRYHESYQPLPMYNNNIWETIAVVRVISISSSFWHMIESTRPERLVTFSSHSMSLKALMDVDLWQRDVINDDSVIFWQCYVFYNGNYRVVPLYLPVSMDATLAESFSKTLINQYKQKRRWAYGIEHFPRIARAFLRNKKIPWGERVRNLFVMLEGNHSWATSSFLILFLGWLPLVVGGSEFSETVIAHNLPLVTRGILTLSMIGLVTSMFLSFFLLPPKPAAYSRFKYVTMALQWILVPIIAPVMGSVPAIDAQTRLMLGKYFANFWVSEKVRKGVGKSKK
jgi:hypothetical protein